MRLFHRVQVCRVTSPDFSDSSCPSNLRRMPSVEEDPSWCRSRHAGRATSPAAAWPTTHIGGMPSKWVSARRASSAVVPALSPPARLGFPLSVSVVPLRGLPHAHLGASRELFRRHTSGPLAPPSPAAKGLTSTTPQGTATKVHAHFASFLCRAHSGTRLLFLRRRAAAFTLFVSGSGAPLVPFRRKLTGAASRPRQARTGRRKKKK